MHGTLEALDIESMRLWELWEHGTLVAREIESTGLWEHGTLGAFSIESMRHVEALGAWFLW